MIVETRAALKILAMCLSMALAVTLPAHSEDLDKADIQVDCSEQVDVCIDQKMKEFDKRGTLGIGLHPGEKDGLVTWTVHRLVPTGVGKASGLEPGDVVLTWNGKAPSTPEHPDLMSESLSLLGKGERVEIEVLRGEEVLRFSLVAQPADMRTKLIWLHRFLVETVGPQEAEAYMREAESDYGEK